MCHIPNASYHSLQSIYILYRIVCCITVLTPPRSRPCFGHCLSWTHQKRVCVFQQFLLEDGLYLIDQIVIVPEHVPAPVQDPIVFLCCCHLHHHIPPKGLHVHLSDAVVFGAFELVQAFLLLLGESLAADPAHFGLGLEFKAGLAQRPVQIVLAVQSVQHDLVDCVRWMVGTIIIMNIIIIIIIVVCFVDSQNGLTAVFHKIDCNALVELGLAVFQKGLKSRELAIGDEYM